MRYRALKISTDGLKVPHSEVARNDGQVKSGNPSGCGIDIDDADPRRRARVLRAGGEGLALFPGRGNEKGPI